jgi:CRISPR-associated endonuclease Csn1
MRYRLGLDVGTASLAAAAVSLDTENQPQELVWRAIRIFSEPLENDQGKLKSKKAARRAARMQRRQIDRRRARARHIAALGNLLGLTPQSHQSGDGTNLVQIRALAARYRVELHDLLRIFLRMAKRRGYAGEFRPKKEGAKLGEVEGGNNDLKAAMHQLAEAKGFETVTLGEYLYHRLQQGLPTKLKVKADNSDASILLHNLYALRSQVEEEFDHIWQTQSAYHPVLNAVRDGQPVKMIFRRAMFYQRPLKSVGGMVGQCSLEPTLPRAPRAQPAFQRFRIEKTLADLRWGAGKRAERLTPEQRNVIRQLLDEKEKASFTAIYKALEKAGCPKPETRGLNLEGLSRDELHGHKTNHVFHKLGLESEWRKLDERTQVQAINFLADLGSPEQLDDPQWHARFVRRARTDKKDKDGKWIYEEKPRVFDQAFVDFINLLKQNEKFDRLSKMGFDGGRASYSVKGLNRLTEWLISPWWPGDYSGEMRVDEEAAVCACYNPGCYKQKAMVSVLHSRLSAPKPTGNAVVDGALRQMRFEVNRMIDALGAPPAEIVVEMAREMSLGPMRRNEREAENAKNRNARLAAEKAIREANETVTPSRIRKYLLWREQGEKFCPYCERPINLADALSGAETEYEHILPKTLTQVGMKRSEIVLAHRSCNQEKGNRTPWEAWGDGRDPARWNIVEQRADWFEKNRQYRKAKLLRLKDHETEVLTDETIAGFSDSQFHQTSWIAKEAALWLQSICPTPVSVSRGQLTAMLRRGWKLETVIPEARVAEGLPVLDEEGAVITPEEFERFRPIWEGHRAPSRELHTDRKLNKRIDHRHHLIDAIVIALTSRSLFQAMARRYKMESENRAEGERPRLKTPEPPLRTVREAALAAVRECPLTIKPDRYPDGAMFQGTAYGVAQKEGEEKLRLTLRQPLAELVDRKKGTVEQARKAIASIVSDDIRGLVSKAFEERISKGKTAPAALAEPIYQEQFGKLLPIRKVRCYTNKYAEDVITITHSSVDGKTHTKRLLHAGYAYLETETSEGRIVRQELVTIQQAMKRKHMTLPENTVRLYKGDMVLDMKDNKKYRVGYFKAEGKIFQVPFVDPRAYDAITEKDSGRKIVSFKQAGRLQLNE